MKWNYETEYGLGVAKACQKMSQGKEFHNCLQKFKSTCAIGWTYFERVESVQVPPHRWCLARKNIKVIFFGVAIITESLIGRKFEIWREKTNTIEHEYGMHTQIQKNSFHSTCIIKSVTCSYLFLEKALTVWNGK